MLLFWLGLGILPILPATVPDRAAELWETAMTAVGEQAIATAPNPIRIGDYAEPHHDLRGAQRGDAAYFLGVHIGKPQLAVPPAGTLAEAQAVQKNRQALIP